MEYKKMYDICGREIYLHDIVLISPPRSAYSSKETLPGKISYAVIVKLPDDKFKKARIVPLRREGFVRKYPDRPSIVTYDINEIEKSATNTIRDFKKSIHDYFETLETHNKVMIVKRMLV